MDTVPRPDEDAPGRRRDTAAERQRRLVWEAVRIAEADAEIDAGLFIEEADMDAWIGSHGTDHELPPPQPHAGVDLAVTRRRADLFTPPGRWPTLTPCGAGRLSRSH